MGKFETRSSLAFCRAVVFRRLPCGFHEAEDLRTAVSTATLRAPATRARVRLHSAPRLRSRSNLGEWIKSVSLEILMRVPHSEDGWASRPSWPWRLGRIRDRLMRLASDGPPPGTQPASTGEVRCTSTIRAASG